jgi:hypothetical protein
VDIRENTDRYLAILDRTIDYALASGRRLIVATHPFITPDEGRRQDLVAARLRDRFDRDSRGRYLDLRRTVATNDRTLVEDGIQPTERGHSIIAESLSQSVFRLLEPAR